jgi:hypothetical protein
MPGQLKYKTVVPPMGDGRRIKIGQPKKGMAPRARVPHINPARPSRPTQGQMNRGRRPGGKKML